MDKNIIEVVTFQTKKGISESKIVELSEAFGKAIKRDMNGFLKRSFTKHRTEDKWVELTWWDSMDDAEEALRKAPKTKEYQYYTAAVEMDGVEIFHLEER